ncbi:MAG: SRPBCC family protein [Anaerolineae bacterium]
MSAVEINLAIGIKAPPQHVFDLLTDINRLPELFAGFKDVRGYHGGDVQTGDRWTVITEFMGREIVNEYTVTRLKAPHHLAWDAISPQAQTSSAFEIQATDEGSRVVLNVVGRPRNIFASVGIGMVKETLKQGIVDDLKHIRTLLEA